MAVTAMLMRMMMRMAVRMPVLFALHPHRDRHQPSVAHAALGFAAADFEVAERMADFFSKLVPQGADNLFRPGKAETQGFSGVPVRRVTLVPTQSTSEITQVTRQTFPDSLFVVPDGFTKEAMGMGRGRGRGRGPQ